MPLIYLKRKLRTCRIHIQLEKVSFVIEKMDFFLFFWISRQNFLGSNAFDAKFFKNLKKNPKNGFDISCWILKGTKSRKISSFEALPKEPRSKNRGGSKQTPVSRARWPNGLGVWCTFVSRVLAGVRVTSGTSLLCQVHLFGKWIRYSQIYFCLLKTRIVVSLQKLTSWGIGTPCYSATRREVLKTCAGLSPVHVKSST